MIQQANTDEAYTFPFSPALNYVVCIRHACIVELNQIQNEKDRQLERNCNEIQPRH